MWINLLKSIHNDHFDWSEKSQLLSVDQYWLKQLWAKRHAIYKIGGSNLPKATWSRKNVFHMFFIIIFTTLFILNLTKSVNIIF